MARRIYTDEDKANVLVALAATKGNVKRTSRDTGVPEQTVRDWKKQSERGELPVKVTEALPAIALDFADKAEGIRNKALVALEAAIDAGEMKGRDLVPVIGMLTEKVLLVRGQATQRTETVSKMPTPEEFASVLAEHLENAFVAQELRQAEIVDAELVEQAPVALPAATH